MGYMVPLSESELSNKVHRFPSLNSCDPHAFSADTCVCGWRALPEATNVSANAQTSEPTSISRSCSLSFPVHFSSNRFLTWRLDSLPVPGAPPGCPPSDSVLHNMVVFFRFGNIPIRCVSLIESTGHCFLSLAASLDLTEITLTFQYLEVYNTTWSHCFFQATNLRIWCEQENGLDRPYKSSIWSFYLHKLSHSLMFPTLQISNQIVHHPNQGTIKNKIKHWKQITDLQQV